MDFVGAEINFYWVKSHIERLMAHRTPLPDIVPCPVLYTHNDAPVPDSQEWEESSWALLPQILTLIPGAAQYEVCGSPL